MVDISTQPVYGEPNLLQIIARQEKPYRLATIKVMQSDWETPAVRDDIVRALVAQLHKTDL